MQDTVSLGTDELFIRLVRVGGQWRCRAGGGVWLRQQGGHLAKLADLAEGTACVEDAEGGRHFAEPVEVELTRDRRGEVLTLRHRPVRANGVEWQIVGEWWIPERHDGRAPTGPDPRRRAEIGWRYEFRPGKSAASDTLLCVPLSLLPGRFRTCTLGAYSGYLGATAYAVHPTSAKWWPRHETERLAFNVHYPMTLKPTRRARGREAMRLEGMLIAQDLHPVELSRLLRQQLGPQPEPTRRPYDDVLVAAYLALQRNVARARQTGFLADDEAAFINAANGQDWVSPNVFGIGFTCGFCGHAILPLLEYYEATEDESARRMAHGIATFIARHAQTIYGAYWDNWDAEEGRGFDFIGEDHVYPHTTARIAENMLAAGQHFGDDAVTASGLRACDWLLSLQSDDGGLPWMVVGATGAPAGVPSEAVTMAGAISAWVQACGVTDRKRYHNAARRLAEYVDERFIRQRHFSGYITDDRPGNGFNRWETPSSTAGTYAVDGLLDLYEHSREDRWLDAALRAAHFQSLWQWLWEPGDRLRIRILGSAQQGSVWEYTLKQTLGGENLYMVWNYLRLWEVTQDSFWRTAAELGLSRAEDDQVDDPDDLRYGGLKEGWDLNEDQMIPITEHGPHVNFLGVSYLIRDIVRYRTAAPQDS